MGIVRDPCLIGSPATDPVKVALTPAGHDMAFICNGCMTGCGIGVNDGLRSTILTGGGVYDGLRSILVAMYEGGGVYDGERFASCTGGGVYDGRCS